MLNLQEKQVHVAICDDMKVEEAISTVELIKIQYQSCAQHLFYVALVPEDAPMPDQATRNAMTIALRQIQEYCESTAVIFTGKGLKASMKRTLFAGILMVVMRGKWYVAESVDELIKKSLGDPRRLAQLQVVARLAAGRGFRI